MIDFYQLQSENRRKSFILIAIFIGIALFLGAIMDFVIYSNKIPVYTTFAFLVSGVLSLLGFRGGDKLILASMGAVPIFRFRALPMRRAMNVISEVSIASGIPLPEVYIIDEDFPNAMTVGARPETAKICLTRGLVESMTRDELQGVIAHEFAHLKSRDTQTFMILAVTWGALLLLSNWFLRGGMIKALGDKKVRVQRTPFIILGAILALLSPIIARIIAMAVSRRREYLADAIAVELTRNPLGLAKALERIRRYRGRKMGYLSGAHMFIADPLRRDVSTIKDSFFVNLFNTHPPIERRIEILARMAHLSPSEIEVKDVEKFLVCPGCGKEMEEVVVKTSSGTPLKLDQCSNCGGIWFDRLELFSLGPSPDLSRLKKPDFQKLIELSPPSLGGGVCPHCGVKLTHIKDPVIPPEVKIMRCHVCGGIYLNYVEFKIYLLWRKEKEKITPTKERIKLAFMKGENGIERDIPSRRYGGETVEVEKFYDFVSELVASILSGIIKG